MRVKICGITHTADAIAAAEAGADAIGLNFISGPRRIDVAAAREILRVLPPMVVPVALVRLDEAGLPRDLLELFGEFRVSHLQVYGQVDRRNAQGAADEMPALSDLAGLIAAGFRPMPVLAVRDGAFSEQLAAWEASPRECRPSAVVLDAYDPSREGGTGRSFRWEWVGEARRAGQVAWPRIILAGGLNPLNVAEATRIVQPYGIDVSSGVEVEGCPGRKDRAKLIAFVRNARAAMDSLESERTL